MILLTKKTKLENKPYVAYSTKEGKVAYTVVPKLQPDNEIWYVAGEPGRYYNTCCFHKLNSENKPGLISNTCENNKGVIVFDGPVTLIEGIQMINMYIFEEYTASPFENIPGEGVYEHAHLLEITLPSTVNQLGYKAFAECMHLTNIDLKNVQTIGDYAFNGCTGLTNIDLKNVQTIGYYAFNGCTGLTNIDLKNVQTIGDYVFKGCSNITSITIPSTVTSIGGNAFSGLVISPDNFINNSSLDAAANDYWGAKVVTMITNSLEIQGTEVIGYSDDINWNDVVVPNGITRIETGVFDNTPIKKITIPISVTSIGHYAFRDVNGFEIVYEGTMEDWGLISKTREYDYGDWNARANYDSDYNIIVHCTDGDKNESTN